MKVNNKLMVQSYLVTSARYNFSVYEKRILYRLVEICQAQLEGQKLNANFHINPYLYDDTKEVIMPISAFLKDEKDENYTIVKKALEDLNNKVIKYEDDDVWKPMRIIEMPKFFKKGYVRFVLHKEIHDAILDFSKGFRKYELKTAFEFESIYSMRFYELLSGKKEPITYTLDDLKIMFNLEHKYKETKDFVRRVVEPAQSELKDRAPFSFEYKPNTIRKKIVSITFHTYEIKENKDPELEEKTLKKQTSVSWDLDKMIVNYLKENYLFETDEIKHNRDLFVDAHKELDLMNFLAKKRRIAHEKKNPKGYLVGALKRELNSVLKGEN